MARNLSGARRVSVGTLFFFTLLSGPFAAAQVSIDGISFRERIALDDFDFGAPRGAIGVIDYDDDGFVDLFIGGGANIANGLYHNVPDPNIPGARTFVDVTAGSGLDTAEALVRDAAGVLTADYDNDGDTDVFLVGRELSNYGQLYRNEGGGQFTNVSVSSGVRQPGGFNDSGSYLDYDLDGDLDLIVSRTQAPYRHLLENDGAGHFVDASERLPAIAAFTHCYAQGSMDFDNDGYADCFLVTNTSEVLFHNVPDPAGGRRFVNVAADVGYVDHGPAPMGIAFGDYDNDGDFDIALSNGTTGTFYRNDDGEFVKFTPFTTFFGWGVNWLDVDNDGDLDYFGAGSHPSTANFDILRRNQGAGVFDDISPALNGLRTTSKFSAQLDFNNDGRIDIMTLLPAVGSNFYENISTTTGHWLRVRLIGDGADVNRDACGAIVRISTQSGAQIRLLSIGSSTVSTEDPRLHFGLGEDDVVSEIEVRWPRRGSVAAQTDVYQGPFAADQLITLTPRGVVGDIDGDCEVGLGDLAGVLAHFGEIGAVYEEGDLTGDGAVDLSDLADLLSRFGRSCAE